MDSRGAASTPVDGETLARAFLRLCAAFPQSFPDDAAQEDKVTLWRELLDDNAWITPQVFVKGVRSIAFTHKGGFLPPPAEALDYFHQAKAELDRDQERTAEREVLKALPAPESEHALTEQEVNDVIWIRGWYSRTIALRRDAACLDERLDPAMLAFQRECEAYEDVIGHLPELPPEQLKAALMKYRDRQSREAVPVAELAKEVRPALAKAAEKWGAWPR